MCRNGVNAFLVMHNLGAWCTNDLRAKFRHREHLLGPIYIYISYPASNHQVRLVSSNALGGRDVLDQTWHISFRILFLQESVEGAAENVALLV